MNIDERNKLDLIELVLDLIGLQLSDINTQLNLPMSEHVSLAAASCSAKNAARHIRHATESKTPESDAESCTSEHGCRIECAEGCTVFKVDRTTCQRIKKVARQNRITEGELLTCLINVMYPGGEE